MKDKDRLELAREKAKERSKELFKPVSKEIEDELGNETTLGNPKNLVKPDNKQE